MDLSDARGMKRPRTDYDDVCPNSDSVAQPQRSTPWFPDGNIVLEAEQSQFRVYRGILAVNSEVFRDMFNLAQAGGEEVDGCPIVQLSDKAEDLRHVLDALHNSKQYIFNINKK